MNAAKEMSSSVWLMMVRDAWHIISSQDLLSQKRGSVCGSAKLGAFSCEALMSIDVEL